MRSRSEDKKALTSLRVFRKFITKQTLPNGESELDASQVVSRECFELWLKTRKTPPPCPEKAFQRALSAHIGGVDGRSPFTGMFPCPAASTKNPLASEFVLC